MDIISFFQGAGLAVAIISVGIVLGVHLFRSTPAEKPRRRRRSAAKSATPRPSKPELVATQSTDQAANPNFT